MQGKKVAWNTSDELKFLEGLGTHSELLGVGRKDLLERYAKAMSRRVNWGSVNKDVVAKAITS